MFWWEQQYRSRHYKYCMGMGRHPLIVRTLHLALQSHEDLYSSLPPIGLPDSHKCSWLGTRIGSFLWCFSWSQATASRTHPWLESQFLSHLRNLWGLIWVGMRFPSCIVQIWLHTYWPSQLQDDSIGWSLSSSRQWISVRWKSWCHHLIDLCGVVHQYSHLLCQEWLPLFRIINIKWNQCWIRVLLDIGIYIILTDDTPNLLQWANRILRMTINLYTCTEWNTQELILIIIPTKEICLTCDRVPYLNMIILCIPSHHIWGIPFWHGLSHHHVWLNLPLIQSFINVVEEVTEEDSMLLIVTSTEVKELLWCAEYIRQILKCFIILSKGNQGNKPCYHLDGMLLIRWF